MFLPISSYVFRVFSIVFVLIPVNVLKNVVRDEGREERMVEWKEGMEGGRHMGTSTQVLAREVIYLPTKENECIHENGHKKKELNETHDLEDAVNRQTRHD